MTDDMATAFGIVSGAVGIASAFRACVDCFELIQLGRRFGQDFQTDLLVLNCTRLRLTRWGEAVKIYSDPKLGRPDATKDEIENVQNILHQILLLFDKSANISKKYRLRRKAEEDLPTFSTDEMEPVFVSLTNKMKTLAISRQKHSKFLNTTIWAIHDRSQFKDLIEGIVSLLDNVEKLFPAPSSIELVKQEIAEIPEKQGLKLVQDATQNVDSMLHNATKEALGGHRYLSVTVEGKAHTGDAYSENWKGKVTGTGIWHTYDKIQVCKDGKAAIGNMYGEKPFWEE
ncbi:MAG: hypothetical protein M1822_005655 [Bathelium mastoideum]|nr:MAG: hypothetical protein M1822_005655 [Bathelium mastoideum]